MSCIKKSQLGINILSFSESCEYFKKMHRILKTPLKSLTKGFFPRNNRHIDMIDVDFGSLIRRAG